MLKQSVIDNMKEIAEHCMGEETAAYKRTEGGYYCLCHWTGRGSARKNLT